MTSLNILFLEIQICVVFERLELASDSISKFYVESQIAIHSVSTT